MARKPNIADDLLEWWDAGHTDLPWRRTRDPYTIWVAEVMLQQTQIKTVIPYFERWIARFPAVETLAASTLDEVLKMWEGLGYYGRARNLHSAAQKIVADYGGRVPAGVEELIKLRGVGRYTAGAIASIAFQQPVPILDGNITRVFSRLLDLEDDVTLAQTKNRLWKVAGEWVPRERPGAYNQALMELGQRICQPANPKCHLCPLSNQCLARARGTQLERPVRPARKKIPRYDVTAGVIWREDGRFLITKRPVNGLLGGLWEFPGGKQESGESLTEALSREIEEELGIQIEIGRQLETIHHAYTHFRISLHPFEAKYVGGMLQHLGVADHAWVTLEDLDKYAFAKTDQKIINQLLDGKFDEDLRTFA